MYFIFKDNKNLVKEYFSNETFEHKKYICLFIIRIANLNKLF